MKIHFVTLFGLKFDFDLVDYFITHYKAMNLTSYKVFLHLSGDWDKDVEAGKKFLDAGFDVENIDAEKVCGVSKAAVHPGGFYKEPLLKAYVETLPPADYVMVADSDEFQEWEKSPFEYSAFDLVEGVLYDKFATVGLPKVDKTKTLDENYPVGHPCISSLWRKHPFKIEKILLFKAKVPVSLSGCHFVEGGRIGLKSPLKVARVLHYRWRENVLERIKDRYYYDDEDTKGITKFFGLTGIHILFVTPKEKLGDFVLKLPTLRAIRERFPNSRITGVVSKPNFELASWLGLMDDFQTDEIFMSEAKPLHSPDLVFMFVQGASHARILSKYGAKRIIPAFKLTDYEPDTQFTFNFYKWLDAAVIPRPPRNDTADLIPYLEDDHDERLVLLHPGAGDTFKQFNPRAFVNLYHNLDAYGLRALIVCGPEEKKHITFFKENFCEVFEPKGIVAFAKKILSSACYVGHDSGGSHLAASMGARTLVIHKMPTEKLWQAIGQNVQNVFTSESEFLNIVLDLILKSNDILGDKDEHRAATYRPSRFGASAFRGGSGNNGPQG